MSSHTRKSGPPAPIVALIAVVALHPSGLFTSGPFAGTFLGATLLSAQTSEALPLTAHSMPLDSLRHLFHAAVDDGAHLESAIRLQARLEAEAVAHGPDFRTVLGAYGGALELLRAREARWPWRRLSHLRTGLDALDEAVSRAPHELEVRYLRVAGELHLPGIFRRDEVVRGDIATLRGQLEIDRHDLPLGLERLVRGFLEAAPGSFTDER
jgi:hypothetical protein